MKKILFYMVMFLSATFASAQDSKDTDFAKRLFEAKLAEVSLSLNLSDAQKEKFAPIYEQYDKEMRSLIGEGGRKHHPEDRAEGSPDGKKADKKDSKSAPSAENPLDDAARVKMMKHRMEMQQKAQQIRIDYTDKFAKVLTDKQLLKFFEIEQDIQKRLRDRARGAGHPGDKRPQGNRPGGKRPGAGRPDGPRPGGSPAPHSKKERPTP